VLIELARQALNRTKLHAGRLADLAVHGDARRSRTRIFLQRLVGGEGKLGEDRGKIHVPELRMQQDVSGERAGAKTGELGVQLERLERHARAGLAVHVGWTVDRRNAERMLDVEGK